MNDFAETIFPARALLGEGPVWLSGEQRLYWLDIEGLRLHRFDPQSGSDEQFELPDRVGCFVPGKNGNLFLATQTGIREARLRNGKLEFLRTLAHPEDGKPENRYNDGKASPEGRFWFGSLNMHRQTHRAALYVLDENGCRKMIDGATNSNGLGWSPDGKTFYWIDTPTRRIEAFDYDPSRGELSNRRTVIAFPDLSIPEYADWGRPDGMTVDAEGMIWIAHWMGGRITRWNPSKGELLQTVRLPVSRVTCPTFGGRNLELLFITTASKEMSPEENQKEPESGNLFVYRPEIPGLPVGFFSATTGRGSFLS